MRAITLLLVAAFLLAVPAAAGASAPVSVPVPSLPDALAYAPGHVLWATHTLHGPVVIHQAPATGGPESVLATIPRVHPSSEEVAVSLAANAGGYVVAARDARLIPTGECGCDYPVSRGELIVRGGYDGSLSTLVHCVPPRNDDEQPELQVVAGASGFAVSGVRCGAAAPIDTIDALGSVAPVPGFTQGRLSYAEPFVAVHGVPAGAPRTAVVRVFDAAAGTARDLPDGPDWRDGIYQVLSDGTLVISGVRKGIYVWPPDATTPHLLPGVRGATHGLAAAGQMLFRPAGFGAGHSDLSLIGLDGAGLRAVGAPGAGIDRSPLYLDATTAAFTSVSCQGHTQVTTVDLTDATPPTAPNGCPVQILGSTVRFDRKGRGTLRVACPNGCRSALQLYIDLGAREVSTREINRYVDKVLDSRLANAKLRLGPSGTPQRVAVRLVRPAIALLRRHQRHLRVFPSVGFSSGIGVGPELPSPLPKLTARLRR
jgi:hypothetical protein